MIFFFGSSRSWAAREARRKARQMAQKKRRAMIRTTIAMFSFMVLLISMWSFMMKKRAGVPTKPETNILNQELGNMNNVSLKTTETDSKPNPEMPHPPLEPQQPAPAGQTEFNTMAMNGRKDSDQGHDTGEISRQDGDYSARITAEMGRATQQSGGHVDSIHGSANELLASDRGSYATGSNIGASSAGAFIRGMNQEDAVGGGSSHDEVMKQSEHRPDLHDSTIGSQNPAVRDVLDPEEGGQELNITLPSHTRPSRSNGVMGVSKNVDTYGTTGQTYSTGTVSASDPNGDGDTFSQTNVQLNDNHGEGDGIGTALAAPSYPRVASEGRHYEGGPIGNRRLVEGTRAREAPMRDYMSGQNRDNAGVFREQVGRFERVSVRQADNEKGMGSGRNYDEEGLITKGGGNGGAGNAIENRVALRGSERWDSSKVVTNTDRGMSRVDTRYHGSYVSRANAAGAGFRAGVTNSDLAVRNGGRAVV